MRTAHWLLTPMFALALGCGDDGSDTETDATTGTPPPTTNTMGDSSTDTTMNPTTEEPTTITPTTEDPTTEGPVDPTTGMPTTDPTTGDPTTEGTTGDPAALTCEDYCGIYTTACADHKEYDNEVECLAQCKQWPIGIANETAGDSLGCRLYHVGVASMVDAPVHCPHAGPSGAGVCVNADAPTCADYCASYQANCKDDLNAYEDEADCLDQCGEWYPGKNDMETVGDTIGCRTYHAGVALGDPTTHCPHAGPGGGGVCVTQ